MNVLRNTILLALCTALTLSLSGCIKLNNVSSVFSFSQNSVPTHFTKDYLVSSPWYGVSSTSKTTQCLAKYVFWDNEVVTTSAYSNADGANLKSEDLLFSIAPDTRLTISNNLFYNYQSHGKQFFITTEAHFFRDYDEAIRYADEHGVDCRNSLPA